MTTQPHFWCKRFIFNPLTRKLVRMKSVPFSDSRHSIIDERLSYQIFLNFFSLYLNKCSKNINIDVRTRPFVFINSVCLNIRDFFGRIYCNYKSFFGFTCVQFIYHFCVNGCANGCMRVANLYMDHMKRYRLIPPPRRMRKRCYFQTDVNYDGLNGVWACGIGRGMLSTSRMKGEHEAKDETNRDKFCEMIFFDLMNRIFPHVYFCKILCHADNIYNKLVLKWIQNKQRQN